MSKMDNLSMQVAPDNQTCIFMYGKDIKLGIRSFNLCVKCASEYHKIGTC